MHFLIRIGCSSGKECDGAEGEEGKSVEGRRRKKVKEEGGG